MMDESDTIQLEYKCLCGLRPFRVRYRRKDEDITRWLEDVVRPEMGQAHFKDSPLCMSTDADLRIPLSAATQGIGLRTEH